MPDIDKLKDEINRILFHVLSNEERADKIAELLSPELEKARRWDEARILIEEFRNDALKNKHVIGIINAFIGIIETLAGDEEEKDE